jgi:hypothetical protein
MKKNLGDKSSRVESGTLAAMKITLEISMNS